MKDSDQWNCKLFNLLYNFKEEYEIPGGELLSALQNFIVFHVKETLDEEEIRDLCREIYKEMVGTKQ